MLFLASLASIFLVATPEQTNSSCTQLFGTCSWYKDCVQARYPTCTSPSDYPPIAYTICNRYEKQLHLFSEGAQRWVNRTKLCLQQALLPYVEENGTALTCEHLREKAFDTHVPCYADCGFCKISFGDYFRVLDVIAPAFSTEFGELMKEVVRILWKCFTGGRPEVSRNCYDSSKTYTGA